MSSLWTPSGEHRVDKTSDASGNAAPSSAPGGEAEAPETGDAEVQVEALRQRLAETPAETVVANHCYGLFELGAIYLSANPPLLVEAKLAIDALGMLVEGLDKRLGESAGALRDALAQIRLGYVQVQAAQRAAESAAQAPPDGSAGG